MNYALPLMLLDLSFAGFLTSMAWGAMHSRSTSTGIGLFVSFGLVLALVWARLGAPDLALAEAAIGAGLTGVLLLQAASASQLPEYTENHAPRWPAFLFVMLSLLLVAAAVVTERQLLLEAPGPLPAAVSAALPQSGVEHPVTAVLLNFRAWDTLLELLVLLLALLGFRQLFSTDTNADFEKRSILGSAPAAWPLLRAWSRILAPLLVLVGGYLLWRGAHAPGGAFQAGALLAAALVILRISGLLPQLRWHYWPLRLCVNGGALLFLGVAAWGLWQHGHWLYLPAASAGLLIVIIEVAATLAIAATLGLLVAGDRGDLRG